MAAWLASINLNGKTIWEKKSHGFIAIDMTCQDAAGVRGCDVYELNAVVWLKFLTCFSYYWIALQSISVAFFVVKHSYRMSHMWNLIELDFHSFAHLNNDGSNNIVIHHGFDTLCSLVVFSFHLKCTNMETYVTSTHIAKHDIDAANFISFGEYF